MKKLISFSLFGNQEFYFLGALENALLAAELFPGWICRFYCGAGCPAKILTALRAMSHVEIVDMSDQPANFTATLWRFAPMFNEPEIIYLCRDVDSRLNIRDKATVDAWLASEKNFHIVRDHRHHSAVIMACSFGYRGSWLLDMKECYDTFTRRDFYGVDQEFLARHLYPLVRDKSLIHASFHKHETHAQDFPTHPPFAGFVGAYSRSAPRAFKFLGEPVRLLNHDIRPNLQDFQADN